MIVSNVLKKSILESETGSIKLPNSDDKYMVYLIAHGGKFEFSLKLSNGV